MGLDVGKVDGILISHEHQDHVDFGLLRKILEQNPGSLIYSNPAVCDMLAKESINATSQAEFAIGEFSIKAVGEYHELIHQDLPRVKNSGFIINNKLYFPGDSYTLPGQEIELLALPVGGPWLNFKDAFNFAIAVKPNKVIVIHDGMYNEQGLSGYVTALPKFVLPKYGIELTILKPGESIEI